MDTRNYEEIYLTRWRIEFWNDPSSAEIMFGAVSKLQRGETLSVDDIGVSKNDFPTLWVQRKRSLRELQILNIHNPAMLGGVATEALVYMDFVSQH